MRSKAPLRLTEAQASGLSPEQCQAYHASLADFLDEDWDHGITLTIQDCIPWQETILAYPGTRILPPIPPSLELITRIISAGNALELFPMRFPAWELETPPAMLILTACRRRAARRTQ